MHALLLLIVPIVASQVPASAPSRSENVVLARVEFRKGNFREALAKIDEARLAHELQDAGDQFDAALLSGLSHVYLGEAAEAATCFRDVLLSNPDYELDPLTYGEDAKRSLDAMRASAELKAKLEQRREEIRTAKLRAEETRRLAEEVERKRRELAAIPELVPSIERHNPLLNFLPFGVPQIDQERMTPGVLFAVAQAVSLTATVLTYQQVQSLIMSDGKVAPENLAKAQSWRTGNWVSVGVAAAVYTTGIVDAFLHYNERSLTTVPREEYLKLRWPDGASPKAPAPGPKPSANLLLAPIPGGAAACLVGRF